MEREFLTLSVWDHFTKKETRMVARHLATLLPEPWAFDDVEPHECGDQSRQVAFYRWNDVRFALIPGGTVTLGHDRDRPWRPTPAQRAEWNDHTRPLGYGDLETFLDFFTPLRTVELQPFLIETGSLDPATARGLFRKDRSPRSVPCHRDLQKAVARQG